MKWSVAYHFHLKKDIDINEAMKIRTRNDPRAGDLHCHKNCYEEKTGSQLLTRKESIGKKAFFARWPVKYTKKNQNCGYQSIADSKRESMDYAQYHFNFDRFVNGISKTSEPYFIDEVSKEVGEFAPDFIIKHTKNNPYNFFKTNIHILDENKRRQKKWGVTKIDGDEVIIVVRISEYTPEQLNDFQRGGVEKFELEWKYVLGLFAKAAEEERIAQEARIVTEEEARIVAEEETRIVEENIELMKFIGGLEDGKWLSDKGLRMIAKMSNDELIKIESLLVDFLLKNRYKNHNNPTKTLISAQYARMLCFKRYFTGDIIHELSTTKEIIETLRAGFTHTTFKEVYVPGCVEFYSFKARTNAWYSWENQKFPKANMWTANLSLEERIRAPPTFLMSGVGTSDIPNAETYFLRRLEKFFQIIFGIIPGEKEEEKSYCKVSELIAPKNIALKFAACRYFARHESFTLDEKTYPATEWNYNTEINSIVRERY